MIKSIYSRWSFKLIIQGVGFSFLMLSCTSYKTMSHPVYETGKTYKITDASGKEQYVTAVKVDNDSLILQAKNGEKIKIAKEDITKSKQKKFSWLKTGGVVVGVVAIGIGLTILALMKAAGF